MASSLTFARDRINVSSCAEDLEMYLTIRDPGCRFWKILWKMFGVHFIATNLSKCSGRKNILGGHFVSCGLTSAGDLLDASNHDKDLKRYATMGLRWKIGRCCVSILIQPIVQ